MVVVLSLRYSLDNFVVVYAVNAFFFDLKCYLFIDSCDSL